MSVKCDEIINPPGPSGKMTEVVGNMLLGFAMGIISLLGLWVLTDLLLAMFSAGVVRFIDN